jgi:hypothetical protein
LAIGARQILLEESPSSRFREYTFSARIMRWLSSTMQIHSGDAAASLDCKGSSFVYIERGAPRLVTAALAAARASVFVNKSTLHFEGESLVVGVRGALRHLSTNDGWTNGVVAVANDHASTRHSRRASLARVMLARSAEAGPGSLTFVASEHASDELRQQLFALAQVLTEEFPRASVHVRFVARCV